MIPEDTRLGRLTISEVFIDYEGPQLFSCSDEQGHHLLAVHAPSTSDGDNWLYVHVSPDRLTRVRTGSITLRDAFIRPEQGFVERVVFTSDDNVQVISAQPAEIPSDWLPSQGERLGNWEGLYGVNSTGALLYLDDYVKFEVDLPPFLFAPTPMWEMSPQVVSYLRTKRTRVAEAAARSGRSVVDLIFKTPLDRHEMSASILGNFLVCAQSVVDALIPAPTPGSRKINLRDAGRLDVLPVFAGSFGLRLDTHQAALVPNQEVQVAIQRLVKLLASTSSLSDMRRMLADVGPKAAFKFRKLAIAIEKNASDFSIEVGVPNESASVTVDLSYQDLGQLVEFLRSEAAESQEAIVFRGNLIGAALRTKFFALEDGDKTISGRIGEEALPLMTGKTIGNLYDAAISVISEINEATGQERIRYILKGLEPVVSQP